MASTTTGSASVPVAPVHRARCGTGGGAEAGHASLRAFVAAHAVFATPGQLGHDCARQRARRSEEVPKAPLFVFGGDRNSQAAVDGASTEASAFTSPPSLPRDSRESSPSPFVTAKLEREIDAAYDGARRASHQRPATVFGPSAPREKHDVSPTPVAPKRAREVLAVDDVTALLARCVASDDLSDVHRATELLSGCRVPGKRPRTAACRATNYGHESKPQFLQTVEDEEPEGADAADAANAADSKAVVGAGDVVSLQLSSPPEMSSGCRPAFDAGLCDTGVGDEAGKHDDDELSFLVTCCDIDSGRRTELFMPYIS